MNWLLPVFPMSSFWVAYLLCIPDCCGSFGCAYDGESSHLLLAVDVVMIIAIITLIECV